MLLPGSSCSQMIQLARILCLQIYIVVLQFLHRCWELKPSPPTYGTVCNGTTDDCTRVDNLRKTFVLTRVKLPENTVTVQEQRLKDNSPDVSLRARFPCFPRARFLFVS